MVKFINEHSLSELIGIKAPTLRKWRWEGKGPKFVKFGCRVMYNMKDVETYIAEQTRRSTVDVGEYAHG
tara:strand:- start:13769 stop:13975 length:207 start_codon:yes stop_codon:yes gene_type:complete